jgi:hypothetical protein
MRKFNKPARRGVVTALEATMSDQTTTPARDTQDAPLGGQLAKQWQPLPDGLHDISKDGNNGCRAYVEGKYLSVIDDGVEIADHFRLCGLSTARAASGRNVASVISIGTLQYAQEVAAPPVTVPHIELTPGLVAALQTVLRYAELYADERFGDASPEIAIVRELLAEMQLDEPPKSA